MGIKVNFNIPISKRAREEAEFNRQQKIQKQKEREAKQILTQRLLQRHPKLLGDLGVTSENVGGFSPSDILTATSAEQKIQEYNNAQQAFETLRSGGTQGISSPLIPSTTAPIDPVTGSRVAPPSDVPPTQYSVTPKVPGMNISQTPESKIEQDIFKAGETQTIKSEADVKSSQLSSQFNLNLITENMYDMSELLAAAYEEGGAGDIMSAGLTEAAIRGLLPRDVAEKYAKASALPGKKIEVISKLFPTLTQQIGKEGSVRLVESIFSKLGKSLPGLQTAPKLAFEQMGASIQTVYRVNRALESINLEEFDLTTKAGEANFADRVKRQTDKIRLSKEEQASLNKLKAEALRPLNDYIKRKDATTIRDRMSEKDRAEYDAILQSLGE